MAKSKRKTSQDHEMGDVYADGATTMSARPTHGSKKLSPFSVRVIVIGVLVLLGVVWLYRSGRIVVAVANGKPLFRWQLDRVLVSRFGQQTLESMITEELILDAAKKQGTMITKEEVDAKINEVVKGLGENVNLDELLRYQGMTRADFEHQIRLQLTVEKILSRDITVDEKEIDAFVKENKASLVATEASAQREEARVAIRSQKVSEKIQPWLGELKSNASIKKLLQ